MTGPAACDVIGGPTLTQCRIDVLHWTGSVERVGEGGGGSGASWESAAGAGLGHLGQPHSVLVVDGADYGFV